MRFRQKILILLICLLTIQLNAQQVYKKVIHNTDPEAKCLDGTSPLLYVHEGTEKDKFLLYLIGGGFCGQTTLSATLQSCYKRSKTELGSSIYWPDFLDDQMGTEGLISLNQPLYANWTKVLFAYCDGALMQGGNDSPIQYKGTNLYFRGNRIMKSHFKWLTSTYQLDKASKIMLTGGSAGGLASVAWGNYLQSIVKNPSSVYVVPDSGIFINSTTYQTNLPIIEKQIYTLSQLAHKSEQSPISECTAANQGSEWKCLFIQENYKYLKGKYMFINSQYDEWAITNILRIKCLQKGQSGYTIKNCSNDQKNAIEDYRTKYLKFINQNLKTKGWGMWSIACSQHVYQIYKNMYDSNLQRIPMKNGKTVKDAMSDFVLENKVEWISDASAWPSNEACSY